MFTQRRCSECECRNGEIRCEEAETCGQAGCAGPEYLCDKGESSVIIGSILRTGELSLFPLHVVSVVHVWVNIWHRFYPGPGLSPVINVGKCTALHNSRKAQCGPDTCHLSEEQ